MDENIESGFDQMEHSSSSTASSLRATKEDIWEADPELKKVLFDSQDIEDARHRFYNLLSKREFWLHSRDCDLDDLERNNAQSCVSVLKQFLSQKNEEMTGASVIEVLYGLASDSKEWNEQVSASFLIEMKRLLEASLGFSGIYTEESLGFLKYEGKKAAFLRSDFLDDFAIRCWDRIRSYPTGLDADVKGLREENRDRILDHLGGTLEDWNDYKWQIRNVVKGIDPLQDLIELTPEEKKAVRIAKENHIPFGITPYYVSLMDREPSRKNDHAIRAQVIPPLDYVTAMVEHRDDREFALDFMREHDTSPIPLVTRRYPMIAIMKPYNTCAQICVYCQRNWEIDEVLCPTAMASKRDLELAIAWFQEHPTVTEVLVTGGDPVLMGDRMLDSILSRLSEIEHVERIRLGTRIPVVLPMRINDAFVDVLANYHNPPDREVCLITHFEHPYEVTPESMNAIQKIRKTGIGTYNQQVFTFENSRRFETAALRLALRRIGVDPYYSFNTKGKEETGYYRVPIARILQERKEEARVLPGIVRTDEPVFNIPAIGKNPLNACQHHKYIMLSHIGERFYEFHPWEKNIHQGETYIFKDVPILDYLDRLESVGEDISEYGNIWYYF
jgi:lysine 2,3-aminomutase